MSELRGHRLMGQRFSPRAILETFKIVRELNATTNDRLPRAMTPSERLALLRSGVVFGISANKRDLFVPVRLPEGWTKVPTDDPSITNLVDTNGYIRATLFATTRSAHTEVHRRYSVSWTEAEADGVTTYCGTVRDNTTGEVVHTTLPDATDDPDGSPSEGPFSDNRDMCIHIATVRAESWLSHHYPGWESRAAYWN